jgi:hypothetical protein
MEQLIEELTSLKFWVAVVFVGIVINIISAYAKPLIDRSISAISENYRSKITEKAEEETVLFKALVECSEFRNIHRQQAIFERTRSVWFACLGVGVFIAAFSAQFTGIDSLMNLSFFMLAVGTFSFFNSMKYVSSSNTKWTRSIAAFSANKQSQSDA